MAFLSLTALYNVAIPLGEGPDEPGHLAYVFFLAKEKRLPVQQADTELSDVPGEGHQPPLAYLLSVPAIAWLDPADLQIFLRENPNFIWSGGEQPNAFMRASQEFWPWPGPTLAWHMARAVSAIWGLVTLLFTYRAAQVIWPSQHWLPLAACLVVALNPQFLFSSALVSNDALLSALSSVILWFCLDRSQKTHDWRNDLLLGLLFGLALLTKQSALLLGPLLVWYSWQTMRPNILRWIGSCCAWGIPACVVAGWWYLRNWQLYGDIFGLAAFSAEFAGQPFLWGDAVAWLGAGRQLFSSFWGRFGWMSVQAPDWLIWCYTLLCLFALGGIVRLGVLIAQGNTQIPWQRLSGLGVLLGMNILWVGFFAFTTGLVAWQGRMLFPAISALAILLCIGFYGWFGWPQEALSSNKQIHPYSRLLWLLLPIYAALALYVPFGIIRPAYQWQALDPTLAQANLGQPVYARYAQPWEQGVVLRGVRFESELKPGNTVPVVFTWNSLEPIPRSWTVFVHLVDADGQIVAQSNSRPQQGELPFTRWTPGDWVTDQHILELPADLAPGDYALRVGLYRPEKNDMRNGVWNEDGKLTGDYATVWQGTLPGNP